MNFIFFKLRSKQLRNQLCYALTNYFKRKKNRTEWGGVDGRDGIVLHGVKYEISGCIL